MARFDNKRRQKESNAEGIDHQRSLDECPISSMIVGIRVLILSIKHFSIPSFINPEYELFALYPERFLPFGSVLAVYDPKAGTIFLRGSESL